MRLSSSNHSELEAQMPMYCETFKMISETGSAA